MIHVCASLPNINIMSVDQEPVKPVHKLHAAIKVSSGWDRRSNPSIHCPIIEHRMEYIQEPVYSDTQVRC